MGSGCAFNLVSISLLMPTDMCKFSQFHENVDPNWLHLDLHAIMKLPSPLRIRENVDRGILFPTVSRGDASLENQSNQQSCFLRAKKLFTIRHHKCAFLLISSPNSSIHVHIPDNHYAHWDINPVINDSQREGIHTQLHGE